jgi:hypothetical protein
MAAQMGPATAIPRVKSAQKIAGAYSRQLLISLMTLRTMQFLRLRADPVFTYLDGAKTR